MKSLALLCVSNMVSSMDTEALGGVNSLQEMWGRLGALIASKTGQQQIGMDLKLLLWHHILNGFRPVVNGCTIDIAVLDDAEQLEAVTTALRSIVSKLGQLHAPKVSLFNGYSSVLTDIIFKQSTERHMDSIPGWQHWFPRPIQYMYCE